MGNCVRDPELRYTPSGSAVCDLSLAVNRVTKNDDGSKNETTLFVDITLWAKVAEVAAQYCHKGDPLFVSGRLHMDSWADRQTGEKRTKLKVVGETIQLLATRQPANAASAAGNHPPQRQAAPPARATVPAGKSQPSPDPDFPPDFP